MCHLFVLKAFTLLLLAGLRHTQANHRYPTVLTEHEKRLLPSRAPEPTGLPPPGPPLVSGVLLSVLAYKDKSLLGPWCTGGCEFLNILLFQPPLPA